MSPEEIQDAFTRSQKAERIGNFPYAETLCAAILQSKPDEHRARSLLRRCQMARFRQKHGSQKPQMKLGKSGIFSAKPSSDPAHDIEIAEESLKENPCDVNANQLLLHAAEQLGWAEIEQLCWEAITEGTPSAENLIGKAKALGKQKKFPRAIAILEQAQQQFPGNFAVEKALRDLQAENATNSGWRDATSFRDMLAPGQEESGNETRRLTDAIEKDPRNVSLIDQLVAHLESSGNTHAQLEWIAYRREIEESPRLRRKVFDLERRLGSLPLERELEELAHFVKEHPTDFDLRLAFGGALLRKGDTKAAILQLQAARRHTKVVVRVEALIALAQAYDTAGLQELGEGARTQALQLAGNDETLKKEILYQMAQSLEANQKKEEARARWLELFELDAGYKDTAEHVLPG